MIQRQHGSPLFLEKKWSGFYQTCRVNKNTLQTAKKAISCLKNFSKQYTVVKLIACSTLQQTLYSDGISENLTGAQAPIAPVWIRLCKAGLDGSGSHKKRQQLSGDSNDSSIRQLSWNCSSMKVFFEAEDGCHTFVITLPQIQSLHKTRQPCQS